MIESALADTLSVLTFIASAIVLVVLFTVAINLFTGRIHDLKPKPNLREIRSKKLRTRNPRNNPIT